jgi:prepilin-type N-terminal cleavage/methylation domain-containing protein
MNNRGFTLIEILLVLCIVAILGLTVFGGKSHDAQDPQGKHLEEKGGKRI